MAARPADAPGPAVGLRPGIRACLFDLDGVLTQTAQIHAEAWKTTFDAFLRDYDARNARSDAPFDEASDYEQYVDGRTREDGIRAFLGSRGITIPEGKPSDAPDDGPVRLETVRGIGAAKQREFLALLAKHGPRVYDGSVRFTRTARARGMACAVVTSSTNSKAVLDAAGISDLFDATVDGQVVAQLGLHGKPAPDSYLTAARFLSVVPREAAVFEDALSGVEAGHAGDFGEVVGVDRVGGDHAERLREHGATIVVTDLADLLPAGQVRP